MEKNINIDFHAHILPEMDHGCLDLNMSLKQLDMAQKNGINVVIATSHFYPHVETVESFLKRREAAFEQLTNDRVNVNPKLLMGAEVLICAKMDEMNGLHNLCIENTRIMLMEMPFFDKWDKVLYDTIEGIQKKHNIQIVLAHAERYSKKLVISLLKLGVLLQLNVSAIHGGKGYWRTRYYIKTGKVVALGSDIHGAVNTYSTFKKVIKVKKYRVIQSKAFQLLQL